MPFNEAALEQLFEDIAWREPCWVSNSKTGVRRIACRFCIAMYGLSGQDIERLFITEGEHTEHMAMFHPVPKGD